MAGALEFLDTLVNRAADVAISKNTDVSVAKVGDQTAVAHTSPIQVASAVRGYVPYIVGAALVGGALYFLLRK